MAAVRAALAVGGVVLDRAPAAVRGEDQVGHMAGAAVSGGWTLVEVAPEALVGGRPAGRWRCLEEAEVGCPPAGPVTVQVRVTVRPG
ncbi:hypothetical protein GCM10023323_40350 [Streptomyces thinghirensis]|uniref:Uncharacterized protein n=1 Tax=Streptomyces thinghirensis TaxID=551547 RepID=A0ABP9T5V0_9ACTN